MSNSRISRIISGVLRYGVPPVITVGLCLVLFRDIDAGELWASIRACDYRWILLGFIPSVAACVFRALRWRIQLKASGITPPFGAVLLSIFGTYAVNIVFPRLGEVWRTGYISTRQKAPFTVVFGSMVADRLADTLTVILITLMTAVVAGDPLMRFINKYPVMRDTLHSVVTSPWTYIAAATACALMWWLMRRRGGGLLGRLRDIVHGLWSGFAAILYMRGKWQWLLWTALLWISYFSQLYLAFYASDMTRDMLATHGIAAPLICYVLTTISMGIPSQGGIGPYQIAMQFGLALFVSASMSPEAFNVESVAFGNLVLLSNTLLFVVLGVMTFAIIALGKKRGRHA